ncbi:MAG TPA: bifunctional nuclease family protein [Myxococcota bacterium]|nr:bifunctional nuclease family protein [Myxococcota bacterium]
MPSPVRSSRSSLHVALALSALLTACSDDARPRVEDVAVEVASIAVDPSGTPVVLLEDIDGERSLPIWIGLAEAHSIAAEMEHRRPPRPNTHDLAKRLIDDLEGALDRVVVTELREGTYYAVIFLSTRGRRIEVDARPSDAIALALRCGAPLFVREALFGAGGAGIPRAADERAL